MRKRPFDNIFHSMVEFSSLREAFHGAAKGKSNRLAVMSFEKDLEENLFAIRDEILNGTYEFGPYRSFYVTEPKLRLIESACFRDRVVHHAIHNKLQAIYYPKFYHHSYACIPGKGTHAAMLTLHRWLKKSHKGYFLKCDIRKYFPNINRTILLDILKRSLKDQLLLELLEKLIYSAPNTGIPIGNLTSQLFANVYLNECDQFVKRELRERYYIRYMDDSVFLLDSHGKAVDLRRTVEAFLNERLKLELSPEKVRIGKVEEGIAFVGYCLRPGSIRVRGAALRRIRGKVLQAYRRSLAREKLDLSANWDHPKVRQSFFFKSWSSFVGQTLLADNSFYLQRKVLKSIKEFSLQEEARKKESVPLTVSSPW
ncbi:MAG: reverse transcriptase/maturase family protein [Alphaproteobacteria bacterium]|nr:reverse transcriptase/maturase family protein [Alphaproteobacteria bacterium]